MVRPDAVVLVWADRGALHHVGGVGMKQNKETASLPVAASSELVCFNYPEPERL